jgi:hypothetical protein
MIASPAGKVPTMSVLQRISLFNRSLSGPRSGASGSLSRLLAVRVAAGVWWGFGDRRGGGAFAVPAAGASVGAQVVFAIDLGGVIEIPGANDARHLAMPGHGQQQWSQLDGMSGYIQRLASTL